MRKKKKGLYVMTKKFENLADGTLFTSMMTEYVDDPYVYIIYICIHII